MMSVRRRGANQEEYSTHSAAAHICSKHLISPYPKNVLLKHLTIKSYLCRSHPQQDCCAPQNTSMIPPQLFVQLLYCKQMFLTKPDLTTGHGGQSTSRHSPQFVDIKHSQLSKCSNYCIFEFKVTSHKAPLKFYNILQHRGISTFLIHVVHTCQTKIRKQLQNNTCSACEGSRRKQEG